MKPLKFDTVNHQSFAEFKSSLEIVKVIDSYDELLKEIFLIRNPRFKFDSNYQKELEDFKKEHFKREQLGSKSKEEAGSWFYFPWNKILCHFLPDKMHQEVRTARNKNLITEDEQKKFYDFQVGIAGLSVGSHSALTLCMMGGSRLIKLADPDTISASNLNRIRFDHTKVGENKCDVIAELIYQTNPYSEVHVYNQGITAENLDEFVSGLNAIVDAVDNLELKIRLRQKAKEAGIPVIMATDNGDNVIVDIERYDLDPNTELFNGAIGKVTLEEFKNFKPSDMPKLATRIAGAKIVVPKMLRSVMEVGKTLYSWPQLGDAATLAGVATTYAIKRMALGEKIKTAKFEVNLDSIFDPEYDDQTKTASREKERKEILGELGL